MELLVFYPSDTRPKKRHFDGPVSLGVQQAVGENPEPIPGFTSFHRTEWSIRVWPIATERRSETAIP